MDIDFYRAITIAFATVCVTGLALLILWWLFSLAHSILTTPLRRAERARLLLDQIDYAIQQSRPVEATLISLAESRDMTMGVQFHLLTAWMEQGLALQEALGKVPRFLPPQVVAMLRAGQKIGDLRKVIPACRQLLKDAISRTRSAINYLIILTLVLTPLGIWVVCVLDIVVLPKFKEIAETMFISTPADSLPAGFKLIWEHEPQLIAIQICLLVLTWGAVILFCIGPGPASRMPVVQRIYHMIPWRRKRLQRDFSTILAVLLDSGVPEPEALALAADCTANCVFRANAARAVGNLGKGQGMPEAVEAMDTSGEFAWRMANAVHGKEGFFKALAGWHESLDAKAFQQEQAAAHGISTSLVIWSGVFVGSIVISVFSVLVSFVNAGVLW